MVKYFVVQINVGKLPQTLLPQYTDDGVFLSPTGRIAGLKGKAKVSTEGLAERLQSGGLKKLKRLYGDGVEASIVGVESDGNSYVMTILKNTIKLHSKKVSERY